MKKRIVFILIILLPKITLNKIFEGTISLSELKSGEFVIPEKPLKISKTKLYKKTNKEFPDIIFDNDTLVIKVMISSYLKKELKFESYYFPLNFFKINNDINEVFMKPGYKFILKKSDGNILRLTLDKTFVFFHVLYNFQDVYTDIDNCCSIQ